MWLISGDSFLYCFDLIPYASAWRVQIPGNLTNGVLKMSPCPDNTMCVVITPGWHAFVCKIADDSVFELESTALGLPTCAAWTLNEDGYYDCLFGMDSGLIVNYSLKRNQYNVLRSVEGNHTLVELMVENGKKNYALLVSEYEAVAYGGEDLIDKVLLDNPPFARVGIQLIRGTNSQRVCFDACGKMFRISILMKGYILELSPPSGERSGTEQRAFDIEWAMAFTHTEYGMFASTEEDVLFLPRSKKSWTVAFAIPQVSRIYRQGSVIWFVTENSLYYFKMESFLNELISVAKENNDMAFLSLVCDDMMIQKQALLEKLSDVDRESAGQMLAEMRWPFQTVVMEFMDETWVLISYLNYLIRHGAAHRNELISLCFSLYIREAPKLNSELLSFIGTYAKQLNRQQALTMLRDVDFEDGIEKYEEIIEFNEDLVFEYLTKGKIENAIELLPKVKSEILINDVLMKVVSKGRDDLASRYILQYQIDNLVKFIPVLCATPVYAVEILKRTAFDFRMAPLRAFVLCESGNQDEFISEVLSGVLMSDVALGFARHYEMKKAVARCLIEFRKIELAVSIAHSVSPETARELLDGSGLQWEDEKRGWRRFLELTSGASRREGISHVLSRGYLDLDEILDLVEDEDALWMYGDVIEDAVDRPPRPQFFGVPRGIDQSQFDVLLSLGDSCELCNKRLCGSDLISFRCGHTFHAECVTQHVEDMFFHFSASREHPRSVSCPKCGFLGTLRVVNLHP